MSEHDTTTYKAALREELNAIEQMLKPVLEAKPREQPERVFTDDMLDRKTYDRECVKLLQDAGSKDDKGKKSETVDKELLQVATALAIHQEDQRTRRDVKIMRMNHKRLMLGCLETLCYRRNDIDKTINGKNQKTNN